MQKLRANHYRVQVDLIYDPIARAWSASTQDHKTLETTKARTDDPVTSAKMLFQQLSQKFESQ